MLNISYLPATTQALRRHGAAMRALIADTDASRALTLAGVLQRKGHRVWFAESVAEAVTLDSQFKPHILFASFNLPGDLSALRSCGTVRVGLGSQNDLGLIPDTRRGDFHFQLLDPIDKSSLEDVLYVIRQAGEEA